MIALAMELREGDEGEGEGEGETRNGRIGRAMTIENMGFRYIFLASSVIVSPPLAGVAMRGDKRGPPYHMTAFEWII